MALAEETQEPVGEFTKDPDSAMTTSCTYGVQNTVVSANETKRYILKFDWKPPADYDEPLSLSESPAAGEIQENMLILIQPHAAAWLMHHNDAVVRRVKGITYRHAEARLNRVTKINYSGTTGCAKDCKSIDKHQLTSKNPTRYPSGHKKPRMLFSLILTSIILHSIFIRMSWESVTFWETTVPILFMGLEPCIYCFRPRANSPRRHIYKKIRWLGQRLSEICTVLLITLAIRRNWAELPEWNVWMVSTIYMMGCTVVYVGLVKILLFMDRKRNMQDQPNNDLFEMRDMQDQLNDRPFPMIELRTGQPIDPPESDERYPCQGTVQIINTLHSSMITYCCFAFCYAASLCLIEYFLDEYLCDEGSLEPSKNAKKICSP